MIIIDIINEALKYCDKLNKYIIFIDNSYFNDIINNIEFMPFNKEFSCIDNELNFIDNVKNVDTNDRYILLTNYFNNYLISKKYSNISVRFSAKSSDLGDTDSMYTICISEVIDKEESITPYAI